MRETKCMNGTGSKYGNHVREWRWTAGVAEHIWMVLETFQPWHGAVLCGRKRTDLETETLGEMNRNKCGRENQMERGGWIRRSEPDIHTRNPTLIVYDQFFICYTDRFMDLVYESQFCFPFCRPWLCNNYIAFLVYRGTEIQLMN